MAEKVIKAILERGEDGGFVGRRDGRLRARLSQPQLSYRAVHAVIKKKACKRKKQ